MSGVLPIEHVFETRFRGDTHVVADSSHHFVTVTDAVQHASQRGRGHRRAVRLRQVDRHRLPEMLIRRLVSSLQRPRHTSANNTRMNRPPT